MKVRLTKKATIKALAGEIVEVSPDNGKWLVSNGLAELVLADSIEIPEKAIRRETPEKATTKTMRKK